MKSKLFFLWLTLIIVTLAPNFSVLARGETPAEAALSRYQLALDRIAEGDLETAKVLLADGIREGGDRPELNLLLAYILQKQGKGAAALDAANAVSRTSPLAAAFSSQMKNHKPAPVIASKPAQASSSKTTTQTAQGNAKLARIESLLLQYVNNARRKEGLKALTWNAQLAEVARAHSVEMRDKKYFEHESPTESLKEPLDRYLAVFDDTPRLIAENIFRSWGSRREVDDKDAQRAHNSLMNSPGHRANILLSSVTQIGIGVASNANGDLWVTQMFVKP